MIAALEVLSYLSLGVFEDPSQKGNCQDSRIKLHVPYCANSSVRQELLSLSRRRRNGYEVFSCALLRLIIMRELEQKPLLFHTLLEGPMERQHKVNAVFLSHRIAILRRHCDEAVGEYQVEIELEPRICVDVEVAQKVF